MATESACAGELREECNEDKACDKHAEEMHQEGLRRYGWMAGAVQVQRFYDEHAEEISAMERE